MDAWESRAWRTVWGQTGRLPAGEGGGPWPQCFKKMPLRGSSWQSGRGHLLRGGGVLAEGCGDTQVGSRESSCWNAEAVKENSLLTTLLTPDGQIFHTQPCYGSPWMPTGCHTIYFKIYYLFGRKRESTSRRETGGGRENLKRSLCLAWILRCGWIP